jgi:fibronectin type 3 domain-containing protein
MKKILVGSVVLAVLLCLGFSGCDGILLGDKSGDGFFSSSGSSGSSTPAAPSGVKAQSSSDGNGITVTWNAVIGASYYYVYRSTSASGTYSLIETAYSTSYDDYPSTSGTCYYKVKSVGSNGKESGYSSVVNATYSSGSNLSAPTGVSATSSSGGITVSWNAVTEASYYHVYRATSYSGSYSQVGSYITETSYRNTFSSTTTTYYYKVTSVDSQGRESERSVYASASYSGASSLSAPSGVQATAYSSYITVSWNTVSGASGYKVYRCETSSGTYRPINSVYGSTSYDDDPPTSGTYYYKVTSVDTNNKESGFSSNYATSYY